MTAHDLALFKELVRQRSGLQFEAMAESSLMLALKKRMMANQGEMPSAYYVRLLGNENEFDELVSLLTINETYFYREPKQLDLLINQLLPDLLAKGRGLPLRILSAGCSTGEEPYSIAIALLEKFGENAGKMVTIIAGDIDQHALRRARHAHFHEYAFRGMPPALRERYFSYVPGQGYQLDARVRGMVEFHSLNLLATRLPARYVDFDIVFFRNVSIYFDAPTRRNIQHALYAAMRDTGCLVLGSAETLANDLGVFHLVEEGGQFYFSKDENRPRPVPHAVKLAVPPVLKKAKPPVVAAPLPAKAHVPAAPARLTAPGEWAENLEAVRGLIRTKQHAAAQERIAFLRRSAPADVELLLLESYVLLQTRRFTEAAALAQQVLARDNWSVEAMMLLGFVAKWQDDPNAAIGHFKTATYTRPDCWPAHYYLGRLLQDTEAAKARREYRTALLLLESNPDPDGGLRLPLDLPVADIRFLCERRSSVVAGRT